MILPNKLKSAKYQILNLICKNTDIVRVNGILKLWDLAKTQTKILNELCIRKGMNKVVYLNEDEKKQVLYCCIEDKLVDVICIKNKKILILTTKGEEYIKSPGYRRAIKDFESYLEKQFGL